MLKMKVPAVSSGQSAFTLLELLLMILILLVLATMLLPVSTVHSRAKGAACMSNQKQIDLAFLMYSSDYGAFPMQVSVTNGGTKELLTSGHTFPRFAKLKAYRIGPWLFICPCEKDRKAATNFESITDLNVSYFVNADATTNNASRTILTGDRFLQYKNQPVAPGLLTVTANQDLSWTPKFHSNGGCLGFADGHAEFSRNDRLPSAISAQPLGTNHFSIP